MQSEPSPTVIADPRMAVVMAHLRHGVIMYDAEEKIQLINSAVAEIFGFAEQRVTAGDTLKWYLTCVGEAVGWSPVRTEGVLVNHRLWMDRGVAEKFDHNFDDGNVFEIRFSPLPCRSAIITYVDVTFERRLQTANNKREELTRQASKMIETVALISARNRAVALNARIEAARSQDRAGTFAVVADEIRALSKQMTETIVEIRRVVDTALTAT